MPKEKNNNEAGVGHNSLAKDQLKTIISRIENVNDEMANLAEDRKEIFKEAKGNGFDVKTIRKVIARRKLDAQVREEQDALLETYEGVFA